MHKELENKKYVRNTRNDLIIKETTKNVLQSNKVYIMFSGGVDSTAHLIWLAKLCKKLNKPLQTIEFNMNLKCNDIEYERREIIRNKINEEIYQLEEPLKIDTSMMKSVKSETPTKTQSVFLISIAYPFIESNSVVFFGYHTSPEIEEAWIKTKKLIETLNMCYNKSVKIEAPHIYQPKSKNYAYVLRHKYMDLISYCIRPDENGTPCGVCGSCYDHELSRLQFELTKNWYKTNVNIPDKYIL